MPLPSILPVLASLLIATPPVAPDSTRYPILNHGRVAGEMLVIRDGSSVIVRYIYTDRNRGQRVESRYRLSPAGDMIGFEMRSIGADGTSSEPTMRYEVAGDSARWTLIGPGGGRGGNNGARPPTTTSVKFEPGMFFRTGGIPWENALLVRTLLKQPERSVRLLPQGSARLEIIADTTVSLGRGRQRLRLAMIFGQNTVPTGVWVDERGEFVASDVQW